MKDDLVKLFRQWWLLGAALLLACGGARSGPPDCKPVRARHGAKVWTGFSLGTDLPGTRAKAFANALSAGLGPLGIKVSGDVRIEQRTDTTINAAGQVATTARDSTSANTLVKLSEVEVRGFGVNYCRPSGPRDAIEARVTVPLSEYSRIRRVKRERTLLVVACRSEPTGACDQEILALLRNVGNKSDMKITDAIFAPAKLKLGQREPLLKLGVEKDAAYVFWVRLNSRFSVEEDGVLYAFTDGTGRLVETSDGKAIADAAIQRAKGAVYKKVGARVGRPIDAARASLRKAVEDLHEKIRWWKQKR